MAMVVQPGYTAPPPAYNAPPPGGYYPPPGQPGYPPVQPAPVPGVHTGVGGYAAQPVYQPQPVVSPVVISQGPTFFGETPVAMTCTNCHRQITTCVTYEVGTMAWLIFALLFFVGLWLCSFIPFCVDGCKDVFHHCPSCRAQLGIRRKM